MKRSFSKINTSTKPWQDTENEEDSTEEVSTEEDTEESVLDVDDLFEELLEKLRVLDGKLDALIECTNGKSSKPMPQPLL